MSILIHRAFEREKRDVDLDSQFEMSILPRHLEISRNAFWWRGAILFVPVGTKSAPRAQKRFRRENVTASPYGRKRAGKKSSELAKSQRTKHRSAAIEAAIPANTPHTTPLYNTKWPALPPPSPARSPPQGVQGPESRDAPRALRASPARKLTSANCDFPRPAQRPAPGLVRGRRLRRIARRRRSPNALRRSPGAPAPIRATAPASRDRRGASASENFSSSSTARSRTTHLRRRPSRLSAHRNRPSLCPRSSRPTSTPSSAPTPAVASPPSSPSAPRRTPSVR